MTASEVLQCLTATLSPEKNTRITAELKLNQLFTRPGAYLFIISFLIPIDVLRGLGL